MTIPSGLPDKNLYNGTGTRTNFPFTFIVLEEASFFTIKVVVTDENQIETEKVQGSDYTVTLNDDGKGSVNFSVAPLATDIITLLSNVPIDQQTDYINIGTDKFPAESHEKALDKLTLINKQLNESISRAILLPVDSLLTNLQIPVSTSTANNLISVNEIGDNLKAVNPTDLDLVVSSNFGKNLIQDETASDARTTLGLGTTATKNTGNTDGNIPLVESGDKLNPGIIQEANSLIINNDLQVGNKFNVQRNNATISSGVITYTAQYMKLDTEGGAASDDLTECAGGVLGDKLIIQTSNASRNIIIKHLFGGVSANKFVTSTYQDVVLDLGSDRIEFINDGSLWVEQSRSIFGDFKDSQSTNGYTYLPNGYLLQKGQSSGFGTVITMPQPYSNNSYQVSVLPIASDGISKCAIVKDKSTTQFTVEVYVSATGGSSGATFDWKTTGY